MSGVLSPDAPGRMWEERFTRPLLSWYDADARDLPWRREATPYRVWVSEIMLQQTRVEAALPYFERFVRELPGLPELAAAPQERLYKLWEGLGYYSRVRNMQRAARMLLEDFSGRFPLTVREMTSLPGIGEYTAGAILSIAFQMPVPAVDGNVMRVMSRAALIEEDITLPQTRRAFGALVARILPPERPGDFNQALMDLGAGPCRPNGEPLCQLCPVRESCRALHAGATDRLPVRPAKKERRQEERTVLLFVSAQGVLLRRRPGKGLLAGLWEYPNLEGRLSKEAVRALLEERDVRGEIAALSRARHVFTHIEWHMTGYLIRCAAFSPPEGAVWVPGGEVGARYALPSAFKAYTSLLGKIDAR